ncbi:DUF5986 family protein [Clostridium butyricum]|uniref:DUF5986 family protein n=1 Tax=Clostridium butyricum TaxID=1492 RepID=UPI0005EB1605|nr:DUF5986 family protein [Clostridium butyricum]
MSNNLAIDMENEDKKIIVQALQNGLERFSEHVCNTRTITHMGYTGTKWDMINTECRDALPEEKYDVVVCKRGVWQLILMYDKGTKTLYTLMKEKRYEDVCKTVKRNKVHYLEAIATVNKDLIEEQQEQIAFFQGFDELKKEKTENTVIQLLSNIEGEVKKHVLITFADKDLELSSISALIVTPSLQILYKEDWTEYIEPKYSLDVNSIDIDNDEDDYIELGLKITKEDIDTIKIKRNKEKRNRK